jgi:hypothetical protein
MPGKSSAAKNKAKSAANASRISAETRTVGSVTLPAPTPNSAANPRRKFVEALRLISNLQCRIKNVSAQFKRRCTTLTSEKCSLATTLSRVQDLEAENTSLAQSLHLLNSNHALLQNQYIELESACRRDQLQLRHLKITQRDLIRANERCELDRARIKILLHELGKYKAREQRAATVKARLASTGLAVSVMKIKQKGIITDTARHKILELTRHNVGTQHIMPIFNIMADFFCVRLDGNFGETSVRRVIAEGGLAGYLQLAEAMRQARCES